MPSDPASQLAVDPMISVRASSLYSEQRHRQSQRIGITSDAAQEPNEMARSADHRWRSVDGPPEKRNQHDHQ